MFTQNRLTLKQSDYLLVIVKKPDGWRPKNYFDKPRKGQIVSQMPVASYAEAHDDLMRCNRLSLKRSLDTWAVIRSARSK